MTDFAFLTIADASKLLSGKDISPVEYTQALLDRIAAGKLNPSGIITSRISLGDLPATMAAMSTFENPCGMTIVDRFD